MKIYIQLLEYVIPTPAAAAVSPKSPRCYGVSFFLVLACVMVLACVIVLVHIWNGLFSIKLNDVLFCVQCYKFYASLKNLSNRRL